MLPSGVHGVTADLPPLFRPDLEQDIGDHPRAIGLSLRRRAQRRGSHPVLDGRDYIRRYLHGHAHANL